MPIRLKKSQSQLGTQIAPAIKNFILTNQQQFIDHPEEITPDMGAEALANAIAYGIAKAFESPLVLNAFLAGNTATCVPPAPGPGPVIIGMINALPVEI